MTTHTDVATEERKDMELVLPSGVTFDPLAQQLKMMPARQLNAGSRANSVFECASVHVCVHRGVRMH